MKRKTKSKFPSSSDKRAAVPDRSYRGYGLHEDSVRHEQSQVEHLVTSMSLYFHREVKQMLHNVYAEQPGAVFCFLCTYCCFCYQVTDTELVISDLVFDGHSFQCGYVSALMQVFLGIAFWDGIASKALTVRDPIPSAKNILMDLCLVDFSETGDYLTLNPEEIKKISSTSSHPDFSRFALTRGAHAQQVQEYAKQLKEYPDRMAEYKRMKSEYEALVKTDHHGLSAAELDQKKAAYRKAKPAPLPDDEFSIHLPNLMTREEEHTFMDACLSIPDDYITSLECLLYQLYIFVKGCSMGRIGPLTVRCDAVYVDVKSEKDVVSLLTISVRPCLMRRGLGTVVIWRLMSACCEFGVPRFRVDGAFRNTERLLGKLGGFVYVNRIYEHFITLECMRDKTLQACGLQDALAEHGGHPQYYLVRSLPDAGFLNSQRAVQDAVDAGERARDFLAEGGDESEDESED